MGQVDKDEQGSTGDSEHGRKGKQEREHRSTSSTKMRPKRNCAIKYRACISVISAAGQPFHDEAADMALFGAIKTNSTHPVIEIEQEINSPEFARACAEKLMELMQH